jgi:hypothetical protein
MKITLDKYLLISDTLGADDVLAIEVKPEGKELAFELCIGFPGNICKLEERTSAEAPDFSQAKKLIAALQKVVDSYEA